MLSAERGQVNGATQGTLRGEKADQCCDIFDLVGATRLENELSPLKRKKETHFVSSPLRGERIEVRGEPVK
jgi:hypothetical protein